MMFKKLIFAVFSLMLMLGSAFAEVDVNKGDQAALDGIKGIGPAMSKRILEERKKGDFKDWADFEARVKGIREKSATKLSEAGLTVNGQSRGKSGVSKDQPANSEKNKGKERK